MSLAQAFRDFLPPLLEGTWGFASLFGGVARTEGTRTLQAEHSNNLSLE